MFRLYTVTLGLLFGIGSAALISPIWPLFLLISLITLILYCPRFKSFRWSADFLFALLLGYTWAYTQINDVLSQSIPTQYIAKPITVQGKVIHLPQYFKKSLQFDFQLESICDSADNCLKQNSRIRLNWYQPTYKIKPGQSLTLSVRLKPLSILANPGGRNQNKIYFLARIKALGSVKKLISVMPGSYFNSITDRIRQNALDRMAPNIDTLPYAKIIEALTLGVRQKFTHSDWDVFQKTGTSHLMAISGLHIALFASLFWWVGRQIWRLNYRATSQIPAQLIGGCLGLCAALIYSLLAGFSVPTQRALVMMTVIVISKMVKRTLSFAQILCIAIIAIAIWDVFALYSEGFWLSVIAVFFILALSQNPLRFSTFKLQFALLIAMLPLTLLFFSQFSLVAPLSNFFAIPMIGWAVVPLSLLGVAFSLINISFFASLASFCFYIADRIFAVVWFFLEKIASWPLFFEFSISSMQFILIAIGCGLLLLPQGMPWRWMGLLGFLPVFFSQSPRPNQNEAWFYLLDVGQGLASVVQTRHHVLLFDTGPNEQVLWPFFREKRLKILDQVILSHADNDHIGGFQSLSHHMTIRSLLSSEPNQFKGPWDLKACVAGQSWVWDGVIFEILHPSLHFQDKKNERSCVLRVTVGTHHLLISGDIEKHAEAELINYQADNLKSNIVVVPHHGSLTSSTPAFVNKIAPEYALISVGAANQYGLPKEAVMARYHNIGSTVLLTHQTGAIWFKLIPNQPIEAPVLWREQQKGFK